GSATLLPYDGNVLIAGRHDGGAPCAPFTNLPSLGTCTGAAELYDPSPAAFGPSSAFHSMEGHGATLLPDGSVLLSGGWVCCGITLATVEIYHPAVAVPSPVLLTLSGAAAIQHASTFQLVTADNPAVAGEILAVYSTGLMDGSVIPPNVAIGSRAAEVLWFGNVH